MVSMIAWVKSPHDWGFWSISSFFVDSGLGSLPNWDLTISRKLECGLEKEWQAKRLHLLIRAWSRKPSCDQWLYLTGSGWGIWRGFYDNAAFKVIQPRGTVRLLDVLSQKKLFFFPHCHRVVSQFGWVGLVHWVNCWVYGGHPVPWHFPSNL